MSKRDPIQLRLIGLIMAVVVWLILVVMDFVEFWHAGN